MRGVLAILMCGSVLGAIAQGAEQAFPYTVQVAVDEVEVRCGPGWDFYATQRLARGTQVEVYRHDPGGWLAIRPPAGSFSWVTARHLKLTADKSVAEVVLDGAVAWVGSSVTNVPQHKWQVRLTRDERVEVLGELAMTVGPGFATETYCKIAPPAGEFRWIHAQHALSSKTAAQETVARTESQSDYRHIGGPTVRSAVDPGAASKTISPTTLTAVSKTTLSTAEAAHQVEELKIALSLLVTQAIEQWDLGALRQRVNTLIQQTADAATARDAKAILQRIQEFETLQRRYQKSQTQDINNHQVRSTSASEGVPQDADAGTDMGERAEAGQAAQPGSTTPPRLLRPDWIQDIDAAVGSDVAAPASDAATPYTAEGWLMPVHSTKRVAPPFAVLDDDGRVRAYVTPAPGLNLRRYTKQYVGVIGNQRYVDALRAPHVTAERVVKQKRD
jgi:hypothetical protein